MHKFLSARVVFGVLGLGCAALLAMAWYAQYGPDRQQPCPLCILQRYGYIMLAAVYLCGAVHGPRRTGRLVYASLASLLAAAGVGLATWQVAKGGAMLTCLADPIGDFVNNLPTANAWPEFFFATGGCADKLPPVLGLTVPVWSLICYAVLLAISLTMVILVARQQRPA